MFARGPILSLLLSVVLALSGGTMVVMRAQMAQASSIVICTGYGVSMVMLDARGEPIESVHPCPDCTASVALAALPGIDWPEAPMGWAALALPPAPPVPVAPEHLLRPARGPPQT